MRSVLRTVICFPLSVVASAVLGRPDDHEKPLYPMPGR